MERKSFLDQNPPPGYIPGIGRGATGFTTRSDIGNARIPAQLRPGNASDEENFEDAENPNDKGLLGSYGISKDDEEADEIYKDIDDRMKNRSYKRKVALDDKNDNIENINNISEISNQFVDLKKDLATISEEEWTNLPEVGDLTRRNKRQRKLIQEQRRAYAAPDSVLAGLGVSNNTDASVDLGALTSERQRILQSKLDANFDLDGSAAGVFDTTQYLTDISGISQSNDEEIKKIKTILSSYTKADPKKPEGWIARARLEEFNKNFDAAKRFIQQGCDNCSHDVEIWLENIRLNALDTKYSKILVAEALNFNPRSLKLWLQAVELEQETFNKRRVLRKAIENLPTCSDLWLKSIELEDEIDDKIKINRKAIELIPKDESLWLTLISLQHYEDATKTINKARKHFPNNIKIWMTACKLEFEHSPNSNKLDRLVKKAFEECFDQLTRDEWYQQAIILSNEELPVLASLLIDRLLYHDEEEISEKDWFSTWLSEAEKYEDRIFIYRTILNHIILKYPKRTLVWKRLIKLYKQNFDLSELFKIFENITEIFPKNPLFWLMYSKEVWKSGNDILKAKAIVRRALSLIPTNVDIWAALIKLEQVDAEQNEMLALFKEAIAKTNHERIWYKFITYLRVLKLNEQALENVEEGLAKFPTCSKLYMQKAQILESHKSDLAGARAVLSLGTKNVPKNVDLWILLTGYDIKLGNITRARSDLDIGILKNNGNDGCDRLWLERLRLESSLGNHEQVGVVLAEALKLFPHSSHLWSFNLQLNGTKKSARKTLYQDALTATNNHARILIIIGHNFWIDGKFEKAKRWFERAILADEDFGDSWAWLYTLMIRSNVASVQETETFLRKFNDVEPRHGDLWPVVSKRVENLEKDSEKILKIVGEELLKSK